MKKPGLLFILWILFCPLAQAEYRVFLLKIQQSSADPKVPGPFRLIESNLDPEQYLRYYPIYPGEKISYIDTWRCRGRTDWFQSYCKSPRAPAEAPVEGPNGSDLKAPPQDQISNPAR